MTRGDPFEACVDCDDNEGVHLCDPEDCTCSCHASTERSRLECRRCGVTLVRDGSIYCSIACRNRANGKEVAL